MAKSIVTAYMRISAISGNLAQETHHLIWGRGGALRSLADKDGLTIPLTIREHTGAAGGKVIERIHDNPMAEHLSKMLGHGSGRKRGSGQACVPEAVRRELFIADKGEKHRMKRQTMEEYVREILRRKEKECRQ